MLSVSSIAGRQGRWKTKEGARSFHVHEPHLVGQAVGQHRVSLARHIHIAHDVTPARNDPALEFFGCRIEANNGVGFGEQAAQVSPGVSYSGSQGVERALTQVRPCAILVINRTPIGMRHDRKVETPASPGMLQAFR
jgi:hypothetical protein